MADPHLLLLAGAVPVAGDRVPWTAEADEALAVDVQEIPRARPFVQPRPLARLPGRPRDPGPPERPPDGRVWMTELARDQPRSPAERRRAAQIRSCSTGGKSRGERRGLDE